MNELNGLAFSAHSNTLSNWDIRTHNHNSKRNKLNIKWRTKRVLQYIWSIWLSDWLSHWMNANYFRNNTKYPECLYLRTHCTRTKKKKYCHIENGIFFFVYNLFVCVCTLMMHVVVYVSDRATSTKTIFLHVQKKCAEFFTEIKTKRKQNVSLKIYGLNDKYECLNCTIQIGVIICTDSYLYYWPNREMCLQVVTRKKETLRSFTCDFKRID